MPFKPGHVPAAGAGVNRVTRDLKIGIVDAAINLGRDGNGDGGLTGYLEFLASKHPKAFSGLLAKLLPMQVNGRVSHAVANVNVIAVANGEFIADKQSAPAQIEHDAAAMAEITAAANAASELLADVSTAIVEESLSAAEMSAEDEELERKRLEALEARRNPPQSFF